jgi:L-amino acid N-acyltransferase YncA
MKSLIWCVQEIYNHYVEKTIYAHELDRRTDDYIRNRINDIVNAGLPYLVAVARGNRPKGPQGYVSEKIVGFINLDNYSDSSDTYRYTFEMELYVHPGYLCQKIAKCLLDRLLEMANTSYNACGGYEYKNDTQYLKTGYLRVIKTIVLNVHKENGTNSSKTETFLKPFGFRSAGHIPHVGYKLGKAVDLLIYRHTTTEKINAGVPAIV